MLPFPLPFSVRRFGVRSFRDRELEHEFRHVFRSAGVRFFEIGRCIGGSCLLRVLRDLCHGWPGHPPSGSLNRCGCSWFVRLLSAACDARCAKIIRLPPLRRSSAFRFDRFAIVVNSVIASLNQPDDSPYSRFWGVFSGVVFTTQHHLWIHASFCCLTGFMALSIRRFRLWFAKDYGGNAQVLLRLVVHLGQPSISFAMPSIVSSAFENVSSFCEANASAASLS